MSCDTSVRPGCAAAGGTEQFLLGVQCGGRLSNAGTASGQHHRFPPFAPACAELVPASAAGVTCHLAYSDQGGSAAVPSSGLLPSRGCGWGGSR